jgi:branched-chain amino acid transport system ATP-binding protein
MSTIARGLMAKPKLLLMDEPSLGWASIMVDKLVPIIKFINKEGVSVLLVEQNIPLALSVADRDYALQVGRIVLEGEIREFEANDVVRKTYLGG